MRRSCKALETKGDARPGLPVADGALKTPALHSRGRSKHMLSACKHCLAGKPTNLKQTSRATGSEHEPVAHGPARRTAPHAQCERQGTVHAGLTSTCTARNAMRQVPQMSANRKIPNQTGLRLIDRPWIQSAASSARHAEHGSRSKTPHRSLYHSHRCKAASTCHAGMQAPPRFPAEHMPT